MGADSDRVEISAARLEKLEKFIKTVGRWRMACWEFDAEIGQQRRPFENTPEWAYLELCARDIGGKDDSDPG